MDYSTKKVVELKQLLDNRGIEYADNAKKDDLIHLLNQTDQTQVTTDLTARVQQAIKREPARVIQSDAWYEKMKDRPYATMTDGQRKKFDTYKTEYPNFEDGVKVRVTERLDAPKAPYLVADGERYMFYRGKEYTMSEADYDAVKDIDTRVKTIATKDKCCGNAKHENIPVFEVL